MSALGISIFRIPQTLLNHPSDEEIGKKVMFPAPTATTTETQPTNTQEPMPATIALPVTRRVRTPKTNRKVCKILKRNEARLIAWLASNYGGLSTDYMKRAAVRKHAATRATTDLGFNVTQHNILSRYREFISGLAATPASDQHISMSADPVIPRDSLPEIIVSVLSVDEEILQLKRVINAQHLTLESHQKQINRLFGIARKYYPGDLDSAEAAIPFKTA